MAEFVELPDLRIGKDYHWILRSDLVYLSDIAGRIVVPTGFVTDLASIPKWVPRWICDPNGRHRPAAIVHDYLVRQPDFDRPTADRIFLEAMKVLDERPWRAYLMYGAVRLLTYWLSRREETK